MPIRIHIDPKQVKMDVAGAWEKALFALTSQIAGDCNQFCKVDQHTLENSIRYSAEGNKGEVSWSTVYAKRQYWEIETSLTPGRTWKWCETAKARYKSDWQRIAEKGLKENL